MCGEKKKCVDFQFTSLKQIKNIMINKTWSRFNKNYLDKAALHTWLP